MDKLRVKVYSLKKDQKPRTHDTGEQMLCLNSETLSWNALYLHARNILQRLAIDFQVLALLDLFGYRRLGSLCFWDTPHLPLP